jgi:hypothetical protein
MMFIVISFTIAIIILSIRLNRVEQRLENRRVIDSTIEAYKKCELRTQPLIQNDTEVSKPPDKNDTKTL